MGLIRMKFLTEAANQYRIISRVIPYLKVSTHHLLASFRIQSSIQMQTMERNLKGLLFNENKRGSLVKHLQ